MTYLPSPVGLFCTVLWPFDLLLIRPEIQGNFRGPKWPPKQVLCIPEMDSVQDELSFPLSEGISEHPTQCI